MSVSIEEVGEHTAKHGNKLFKNKKFLIIAGVVAALGLFMYMKKKNASSSTGTAAFSNYPTPPSETGNIPSNVGSGSVDTGSAGGTYDPTTTANDPYSANLGNYQAPLMTPVMYQAPIANVPLQQIQTSVMDKTGVAPGGFETMVGDSYTQQGNKVTVTDKMGGVGAYDMVSHNSSWDYSKANAPGQETVSHAFATIPSRDHESSSSRVISQSVDHVASVSNSQANNVQDHIAALGREYNDAMSRGDTGAMKTAHDTANELRSAIGQKSYHDSITDR